MKTLKNQIKKSISLFLAVLMVLSCWVWVDPALAAEDPTAENGYYYIRVVAKVSDNAEEGMSTERFYVDYLSNNGTSSSGGTSSDLTRRHSIGQGTDEVVTLADGYVKGWPTKVHTRLSSNSSKGWRAESVQFQVYNYASGAWVGLHDAQSFSHGKHGTDNKGNGDYDDWTITAASPAAASIRNVSDATATIPKFGEINTTSDSTLSGEIFDQYGVRFIGGQVPDGYYLADVTGKTRYSIATHGIGINQKKIEASSLCQEKILGETATGTSKISLFATYGDVVSSLDEAGVVTLYYPTYNVKVYQDGSIDGLKATMNMSDNKNKTDSWEPNPGIYGEEPSPYPTGGKDDDGNYLGAKKDGYTFVGFWTQKQPTDGFADFNAISANFAMPISSTQFDTYAADDKNTVSGRYVTVAGKTYYNAGTEWNADERAIKGDIEYFGWWLADDIAAKFYDIDGKYLGSRTFKYGDTPAATEYPDPRENYYTDAFEYSEFKGVWRDITGVKVTEGSYKYGALYSLTLTPTYSSKVYKNQYNVSFIKVNGTNLSTELYDYRYMLKAEDKPTVSLPSTTTNNDFQYTYEFAGWSSEVPENGMYHAIDAAEVDEFLAQDDFIVRGDITYYAVFKTTVKKYVIGFTYYDTTGTRVTKTEVYPYGAAITIPSYVNSSYAQRGVRKTIQNWTYNSPEGSATLDSDKAVILNDENLSLTRNNLADGDNERAFAFSAAYDAGVSVPYAITFKYKSAKGEAREYLESVTHGKYILQDTVDSIFVPEKYDDGEAEYTFADKWIITAGTIPANGKVEYTTAELLTFSPTSDVTFEAVYSDGVPFYTVTYIDGLNKYSERVLQGTNVPEWTLNAGTEDEMVYVPVDKKVDTGINKFAGWYDEKQTDAACKETNGKKYTTADTVESDLTLYAQYKYEAYRYSIIFLGHDGTQLGDAYVEAGQSYAFAFDRATKAAQTRQPDETYSYEFIGWDQPYNENKTCEGKDIVFTALYKASYVYYNANWYNDLDAMNNGAAAVTTTKHTYNSSIYNPAVTLDAPAGKHFAGWYYLVDGEAVAFHRGMKITSDMSFYATYEKDDVTYTVTTVVGSETKTYIVGENEPATVVPTPVSGYVDAEKHNKFVGWYTTADFAENTEFAIDTTAITADITIYAKYDEAAHEIIPREIESEPTYYTTGKVNYWCTCNKTLTYKSEDTTLTDTVAPTGTIYLGSGSWSSTDEQSGAADTNKYYANKNTDVVITISDKGDVENAYNPSGKGIGIKMIRVFVSSDTFTQKEQGIAAQLAETIFEDTTETQNTIANYTVKVSDLEIADLDADGNVQYNADGSIKTKDLEEGKEYIVYYYAIDKANNVLNKNVRTAKFTYDTTAPEFNITGKNNDEYTTGTVTYCGSAVLSNIEAGATVTVKGPEGEATITGVDAYTIDKAGNYTITVTDLAGNKVTKKIKVAADHNTSTTIIKSTCTQDGYKKVECTVCKTVLENTKYTHAGHEWMPSFVPATCTEAGYNLNTCDVCGATEKAYKYTDENGVEQDIQPALDHVYNTDDNGDVIYTVVTKSTCTVAGKESAKCARCGEAEITRDLPLDKENGHLYGGVKTNAPTCTEAGYTYKTCKNCGDVVIVNPLKATGHTLVTTITKAATCGAAGEKVTYCQFCSDYAAQTEAIPATNKHIVKVVETKDPAVGEKGYIKYACETCTTWTKTVEIDELVAYTITFLAEDGETKLAEFKDVISGTTITGVAEPTKASDNTYKYTFAGWADEKGNIIKGDFDATSNLTLKATFKATKILYTHIFMVPTKWVATLADSADYGYETYATIIGAYNDTNKKPSTTPTFVDADENADEALKASAEIVFKGWANSKGEIVTDFTVVGDDTFYAVFEAVPYQYNAVFYNFDGSYLWSKKVEANSTVAYGGEAPKRASDNVNEYTFTGWTVDGVDVDLSTYKVAGKTRFEAKFAATAHEFAIVEAESWAATCNKVGQKTEKCTACGYTIVTELPKVAEHNYVMQEDGSKICSICGDKVEAETNFVTITFNDTKDGFLKAYTVAEGKTVTYVAAASKLTADKVYTFKNWTDAEGNVVSDTTTISVVAGAEDAVYTANYESATRMYRVTYFGYTSTDYIIDYVLPYGTEINKVIAEDGMKIYAPQPKVGDDYVGDKLDNWNNETTHYIFTGMWTINGGEAVATVSGTVTSDMEIYAAYIVGGHEYIEDTDEATCTEPGGTFKVCKIEGCGKKSSTSETIAPLGHQKTNAKVIREADIDVKGEIQYTCDRCNTTYTEETPALKGKVTGIQVYDLNGELAEQATIRLYYTNDAEEVFYKEVYTDASGMVSVKLPASYKSWRATVTFDGGSYSGEIKAGSNDNVFGGPKTEEPEPTCPCTCHKNTFWGFIYRLLQKLFGIFGAKPCCSDQEL